MKIIKLFALFFFAAAAFAADARFVTAGATALPASIVTGTTSDTITATLVFGGLGDAPAAEWAGKVVLLDRGTFTFAAKVKAVQDAGGLAVVIADNVSSTLTTFTIAPSTSTIPAVSITQADGATLKTKTGSVVRVGPAAPPSVGGIPDPLGQTGKVITSDGAKYILAFPISDPGLTAQAEIVAGKSVNLTITANGTPPFSYQWMKDGANLTDATAAALSIASAQPSDSGSYVCQVTNEKGTAASAVHILKVVAQ